jgi:hypothetical protein
MRVRERITSYPPVIPQMIPAKFCRLVGDEHIPHDYGNVYFKQPCGDAFRLVIGPSRDQVGLMVELASQLQGNPWFVLYVLLVPRKGNRVPGRYQSEPFESHAAFTAFLNSFRSFLEGDGRHHVWIGSAANDGLLVYDQHNVIFAYGPLDGYKSVLLSHGFRECEFWFPCPHSHAYMPENDAEEERLIAEIEWRRFPLQPGDEWD